MQTRRPLRFIARDALVEKGGDRTKSKTAPHCLTLFPIGLALQVKQPKRCRDESKNNIPRQGSQIGR